MYKSVEILGRELMTLEDIQAVADLGAEFFNIPHIPVVIRKGNCAKANLAKRVIIIPENLIHEKSIENWRGVKNKLVYILVTILHEVTHFACPVGELHGKIFKEKEQTILKEWKIAVTKYKKAYPKEIVYNGEVAYSLDKESVPEYIRKRDERKVYLEVFGGEGKFHLVSKDEGYPVRLGDYIIFGRYNNRSGVVQGIRRGKKGGWER